MVYRAFPLKKNQILVRIENNADKFDTRTAYLKREIDIKSFARDFYAEATQMGSADKLSLSKLPATHIQEVTLSGTMPAKDSSYRWRGDDDKLMLEEAVNKKPNEKGEAKAFLPQSIRSFIITYLTSESKN